ncbi:hypothetical protein [Pseudoclavibacter sp. VKM Ac-2867]|uniref:hypothetical protein n=1 Tax=Pseudoclavibacter sp. VKM Ac-2867 TaxID=2783829 RepID=UPI00188B6E50|nr:hypothetical protein [Pseudoclavibacter sp. VKM Ac-2867]MBF4457327.1 hypothetical protein [Pseudoclavibacter sp. VKM Ac-2867]
MIKETPPIRVMMLPNSSRQGGNPFVGLLVDNLNPHISTVPFTWKTAFTGKYDVFHAHWPEYLLQANSRVSRFLRLFAFSFIRPVLTLRGKPIVVTVHNLQAHSGVGRAQERLTTKFREAADLRVFLNEFDLSNAAYREGDVVIPHGDYGRVIAPFRSEVSAIAATPGRVLLFGGLRANKGISMLIDSFSEIDDSNLSLQICGRAQDPGFLQRLATLVSADQRVTLEARELQDRELAIRIREAQLIALPYPDLYNSGALFMALTLGRPVLVPDSPTARELQQEFGGDRVHLFQGKLTGSVVASALSGTIVSDDSIPEHLGERREWTRIGRAYTEIYSKVLKLRSETQVS